MKKLGIFLISIIFIFQTNLYPYSSDPKMFVEELVNEAINKLSDKDLTIDEKYKFIEKIALENVDINALGLYTLGELRKSSEKKDIIKYQQTFEKYFLKSLTSRLTDYSSSDFEVTNIDKKSSNYTIVSSKVSPKDGNPELEATVIVVSIADKVSFKVVAFAEKVTSPAAVVALIGVMSLYAPP